MAKSKKSTQDDNIHLKASVRTVLGKKVRSLRNQHLVPGNVYGAGFTSKAVQVPLLEFKRTLKKAGETQVVYLALDSQKEELPVLIHHVHVHPVSGKYLHVDFRKVDLKKKIQTSVPLTVEGESPVVVKNEGVLQTLTDTITVEALPDKIPSAITIDASKLTEVGAEVKVSGLAKSVDYTYTDDPEKPLVRIIEHKEEEVAPQVEAPSEEEEQEAGVEGEQKEEEEKEKEPEKADEEQPAAPESKEKTE